MATYLVNELMTNTTNPPEYLDKINWYFIPSANPDGYSWSWDHDRLWRKTRLGKSTFMLKVIFTISKGKRRL